MDEKLSKVFNRLKGIMETFGSKMEVKTDETGHYYVNTGKKDDDGKDLFFGMVKVGRRDVSYHLMALYCFPEMLMKVNNELKDKMTGKSCFKFKEVDENLFGKLEKLTEEGYNQFVKKGMV